MALNRTIRICEQTRNKLVVYTLILLALSIRVLCIVVLPPYNSLAADAQRHVHDALNLPHLDAISALDLPLYACWLHFTLINNRVTVLIQTLLSLSAPCVWWLWMRQCLPSKTYALIGFAILAILPSWSAIYSFFMPETLLLPLCGLSLWLSWLACERKKLSLYLLAALFWGLSITVKPTVAICFLIIVVWQLRSVWRDKPSKMAAVFCLQLAGVLTIYSMVPLRNVEFFHTFSLTPGFFPYNQIYYASGKQSLYGRAVYTGTDGSTDHADFVILSPVLNPESRPFAPFNNWRSIRTGQQDVQIDFRNRQSCPKIDCPLSTRLHLTAENWLFFFLSKSWPDDQENNWSCWAENCMRWLWMPLSMVTFYVAWRERIFSLPVILAFALTAFFLIQQSWVLEGRYRKPWEGLIIVACLDVMARRRAIHSSQGLSGQQTV